MVSRAGCLVGWAAHALEPAKARQTSIASFQKSTQPTARAAAYLDQQLVHVEEGLHQRPPHIIGLVPLARNQLLGLQVAKAGFNFWSDWRGLGWRCMARGESLGCCLVL